jgi:hypothetical protein
LNELIEQNQTIAKSILLLSKKFKEHDEGEKEEKVDFSSKINEQMPDFEGFKPSIKSQETEESESTEESSDESENKDKGDSDEFTPEPLPDFNF